MAGLVAPAVLAMQAQGQVAVALALLALLEPLLAVEFPVVMEANLRFLVVQMVILLLVKVDMVETVAGNLLAAMQNSEEAEVAVCTVVTVAPRSSVLAVVLRQMRVQVVRLVVSLEFMRLL